MGAGSMNQQEQAAAVNDAYEDQQVFEVNGLVPVHFNQENSMERLACIAQR